MNETRVNCAIIICSDRAQSGVYQDKSGSEAFIWLMKQGYNCSPPRVIPDDSEELSQAIDHAINDAASLVVISGGTGLGPRDITPQTLDEICDYQIPGFGELLRKESLKYSLNSYLSRCGAWLKNQTIILALPGNPKAVVEQLSIVSEILPHALKAAAGRCQDRRAVKES